MFKASPPFFKIFPLYNRTINKRAMERKKFTVEVTRCYIVVDEIEVDAFSKREAKDKAVEISNNKDYTGQLDIDTITAEVSETEV